MPPKGPSIPVKVAKALLDIGAVLFRPEEPFRWSSGLISPIYCDNRLTLSHPEVRALLVDSFEETIRDVQPDAIVGVATGGIAHAALLANRLGLPMAYVRAKAKGYGRENQVEGKLEQGSRVVVLEDLIATGAASLAATSAVEAVTQTKPEAVLAIFTYGLSGVQEKFGF